MTANNPADNPPKTPSLPDGHIVDQSRHITDKQRYITDPQQHPTSAAAKQGNTAGSTDPRPDDFITEIYLEYKGGRAGRLKTRDQRRRERMRRNQSSQPFGKGREPKKLSAVFSRAISERGWREGFEQAQVVVEWEKIVGPTNAAHTRVLGIRHTTLEVQCDSTTWTAELRRLSRHIVASINQRFPGANITEMKIYAPGVPSWKHGIRSVPGRGQRDTYG